MAVVVPLMVSVGLQSAWAAFACRVDGQVRDHCCCEAEKQASESRGGQDAPLLSERGCCDVTIHEAVEAPVVREADRAPLAYLPIVIAMSVLAIDTPRVERVVPIATMARPPPRIAMFLDKHAILR